MPASPIRFCTLASGSSGNAVYFDTPQGAILVDAGISGRKTAAHLESCGLDIERIRTLIITHSHHDHVKCAGVLARRHGMKLCMTRGTAAASRNALGKVEEIFCFEAGKSFRLDGFTISSIPTPHDAPESVCLILQHKGIRVGLFTDLGHCFDSLGRHLSELDAVILESNYDPELLAANTAYPKHLKKRIRGPGGHLSNEESAGLVRDHAGARLQAILLAHLSENNNNPALALQRQREIADEFLENHGPILDAAPRHQPSRLFVIQPSR